MSKIDYLEVQNDEADEAYVPDVPEEPNYTKKLGAETV